MKKKVAGVSAVALIALGIWLSQFWKLPGLGGGDAGSETATQPADEQANDVQTNVDITVGRAQPVAERGGVDRELLTIVIVEGGYRLVDDELQPNVGRLVTSTELQSLVDNVKGTPDGIKVRILKSKSAREGARADLLAALTASGVKREEIQERIDFVD